MYCPILYIAESVPFSFGIKELFGISTIIIGAILGFIVWILVTFFNNNGGFGNYEHEDMDHDMPTHVIIDK